MANFLISAHYNITKKKNLEPLTPFLRPASFFKKFNSEQLLFETFFDMIVLFTVFSCKVNFPTPAHCSISKTANF